jgi:PST family polysaccharide transporter
VAPLVVVAYVLGLPHGPRGVALAYSGAMIVWLVPHLAWCVQGTSVSLKNLATAVKDPALAGVVATAASLAFLKLLPDGSPFLRLLLGGGFLVGSYAAVLLHGSTQRAFYSGLIRDLRARSDGS